MNKIQCFFDVNFLRKIVKNWHFFQNVDFWRFLGAFYPHIVKKTCFLTLFLSCVLSTKRPFSWVPSGQKTTKNWPFWPGVSGKGGQKKVEKIWRDLQNSFRAGGGQFSLKILAKIFRFWKPSKSVIFSSKEVIGF